jgi:hypothetical protein
MSARRFTWRNIAERLLLPPEFEARGAADRYVSNPPLGGPIGRHCTHAKPTITVKILQQIEATPQIITANFVRKLKFQPHTIPKISEASPAAAMRPNFSSATAMP